MTREEKDAIDMVISYSLEALKDNDIDEATVMLSLLRQKVLDDEMSYYERAKGDICTLE